MKADTTKNNTDTLDSIERAREWFAENHNPYQFKCGEITVKMQFSETGDSLQDKVCMLLKNCQNQVLDKG